MDVSLETFLIDIEATKKAITDKTFGILAVHTAGNICDLEELDKICKEKNLVLIEDNCDGFGGDFNGKKVGSFGISATSFHAAHIISTGQGGAVFVNDDLAKTIRSMRDWGRMPDFDDEEAGIPPLPEDYMQRYTYTEQGFNFNPIELPAAIGREQLKKVDRFKSARFGYVVEIQVRRNWLSGCQSKPISQPLLVHNPDAAPVWKKRKAIFDKLKEAKIEFRNILASNIVLQPAYKEISDKVFINADEIAKRGFWLSVHPSLKMADLKYIVKTLT